MFSSGRCVEGMAHVEWPAGQATSAHAKNRRILVINDNPHLHNVKNPPDNEAIHRFAIAITKEWECKQATHFEQVLMRAAKEPLANISDPDRNRIGVIS